MVGQKELFSPEARRRQARRIKNEIVAGAKLPPALKAVLIALWDFCGGKRFCWPSQQALAERVGYAWPASRRALQTKLEELERLGLIVTEPWFRPNGSQKSNKYRIVWGNLKRTQSAEASPRRTPRGRSYKRGGALAQTRVGAQASAPGALIQAPLELELEPNKEPSTTPNVPQRAETVGGGEMFSKVIRIDWGYIDPEFPDAEQIRLLAIAREHGLVGGEKLDELRLRSACLTAKGRPTEFRTGWFIKCVNGRRWGDLNPDCVNKMGGKMWGKPMTFKAADMAKVRTNE